MKSSSKSLALVSVMLVAFAGGCELDLQGYVLDPDAGAEDAGKGGGGGAAGSGGGPSSASASSSTSGASGCTNQCNDNDVCTKDLCVGGECQNVPLFMDDGDACTLDLCDSATGMFSHQLMEGCCTHSVCVAGDGPLDPVSCNPTRRSPSCVDTVCMARPECCEVRWDTACVTLAKDKCKVTTGSGVKPISCACKHSYCTTGEALDPACDPCVNEICAQLPECCTVLWDNKCVFLTPIVCAIPPGQCQ